MFPTCSGSHVERTPFQRLNIARRMEYNVDMAMVISERAIFPTWASAAYFNKDINNIIIITINSNNNIIIK